MEETQSALTDDQSEAPTAVAALLVRQYLDIVDGDVNPVHSSLSLDADKILAWAVGRAGHLFDGHLLNDYGLLPDGDHLPRCVHHKHLRGDR